MIATEDLLQIFLEHPSVSTDSRAIEKDALFFALKGPRFDGNQYAEAAIDKGAAYAIVDDPEICKSEQYLLVEDGLKALQNLATAYRRRFHIPILAITGSNGKTTTKELISKVLGSHYPTHFTKGNLNNHIGVPLTLLAMPKLTEVAIIEMGANHLHEIDFLCKIAEPTHGLITNIGKAHLEGFGSEENIRIGKTELYRFLDAKSGVIFVNRSEEKLVNSVNAESNPVFYTTDDSLNDPYDVKFIKEEPFVEASFLSFEGEIIDLKTNLIGYYNFENIKSAVTIGKYFKVPGPKIKAAIESYIPSNNRSQLVEMHSNQVVLDAYNANPTSMKAALDTFGKRPAKNKMAILGAMLELGEKSNYEHDAIGELALSKNIDPLILVGKEFEETSKKLELPYFADVSALKNWFKKQQFNDYHILVKGSRGIGLERLLD